MTFAQLHLAPTMARCARALQIAHPTVRFLSGRRDLEDQAHAMAVRVTRDRRWIGRTYLHAAALQTLIDQHPDATTVEAITTLLYHALLAMPSGDLAQVSDHLSGDAVDLLPMEDLTGTLTPEGAAVVTWIHACPDTKGFLTREGGQVGWHWATHPNPLDLSVEV